MAREAGAQVACAVRIAEFCDAVHRHVFDKDMRRFENQRVWIAGARSRIDQRYGSAVAVADDDGTSDAEHVYEPRKNRQRFVMHEPRLSGCGPRV
jgi:hypothetical protein